MANIQHGTLTPNVVMPITADGDYESVEILNRNGVDEIFFRVDGISPAVNGTDSYIVPAAIGTNTIAIPPMVTGVVELISIGACTFTVTFS